MVSCSYRTVKQPKDNQKARKKIMQSSLTDFELVYDKKPRTICDTDCCCAQDAFVGNVLRSIFSDRCLASVLDSVYCKIA